MKQLILVVFTFSLALTAEPLNPAKAGGNPSFEIGISFSDSPLESQIERRCQGTLISRKQSGINWSCTLLTAAHCLADGVNTSKATFLHTADFGVLSHPVMVSKTPQLREMVNDTSVVHFSKGCAGVSQSLVIPLGEVPASPVDRFGIPRQVFMASRMFKTLFPVSLRSDYFQVPPLMRLTFGTGDVNGVSQVQAIYGGDSGGGLFQKNTSGEYELIAIASVGEYLITAATRNRQPSSNEGSPLAVFISDLDWVRTQLTP